MAAPTVQVNIRIDPALYAQLQKKAKQAGNTITREVADAITAHVTKGEA